MKLSIGIIGLPNVGKSTLFKLLTKQEVDIANYPFCTIDPNIGVVAVPDERLHALAALSRSARTIPAVIEFYDIAGIVRGAHKGEGLGNKFLAHIRDVNTLLIVLRAFPDIGVRHVESAVHPARDLEIMETELALKDLETVEKAWDKMEGEAKTGQKEARMDFDALKSAKKALASGALLTFPEHAHILKNMSIRNLNLLTAKSQLYVINGRAEAVPRELAEKIESRGGEIIIADFHARADIPEIINAAYRALRLISFFTTGEDETRAWTIERGVKAPRAAATIHSDFEKNFIRAEVINWRTLMNAGSWGAAREQGRIRLEGKNYVVEDGDVMVIRHGG